MAARCLGLGLCFSILLTISAPTINLWPLAAMLTVPLAVGAALIARRAHQSLAIQQRPRILAWAALVGVGTTPAWMWLQLFLFPVTPPGFVPLGFYLSSYSGIFVWLMARCIVARDVLRVSPPPGKLAQLAARIPLPLLAGGLWCLLEVLRGDWVLGGYAFYNIAVPLIDILAPLASIVGCIGCAAVVAGFGWMIGDVICNPAARPPRRLAPKLAIVAVIIGLPWVLVPTLKNPGDRSLRVGVLQTNLPQSNKMSWSAASRVSDFATWQGLTRNLATANPDVIVWPETMFPGSSLSPQWTAVENRLGLYLPYADSAGIQRRLMLAELAEQLVALQAEIRIPVLIGAVGTENPTAEKNSTRINADSRFNSVFMIRGGKIEADRYDKGRLVPFGEYIPIAWRLPELQNAIVGLGAKGMSFDLGFGSRPTVFIIKGGPESARIAARVVTPICFEMTYPGTMRSLVFRGDARRADLIITPSNDGWFGWQDSGRITHLQIARWRAAELGTPVVRAVNTGISCVIDGAGVVLLAPGSQPLPARQEGTLVADVPLAVRSTLYTHFGDWPAIATGIFSIFVLSLSGRVPRPSPSAIVS